jgi:hypothetical protein
MLMQCKPGERYKIQVPINGILITYTAIILGRDEIHLMIKDRDNKIIQILEKDICFSEKLGGD